MSTDSTASMLPAVPGDIYTKIGDANAIEALVVNHVTVFASWTLGWEGG